nr:hypothetical protein [uncultured archaeon]
MRIAFISFMKIDPIQKLTEAIRNHGIFKRNKKPIEEKALALLLYMSGLSSWQILEQLDIYMLQCCTGQGLFLQ